MQRRKFVLGLGTIGALTAGATGTGAFSLAQLNNGLQLDDARGDDDGFVSLAPSGAKITDGGKAIAADGSFYDPGAAGAPSYPMGRIISVDGDGNITIDLNGNSAKSGYNDGSVYYFDNALQIYILKKNDQVAYLDGTWDVSFSSLPDGVEAYEAGTRDVSSPFSKQLDNNEGVLVGFKVTADDITQPNNNNLTATIEAELV